SVIHRLDPAVKIIMTVLFAAALFYIKSPALYLCLFILTAALVMLSRLPFRSVMKGIKPVLFLAVFTVLANAFFADGSVIFHIGGVKITYEGLFLGLMYAARLIILVAGASILTLTTAPMSLTDGIERLMSPLKIFHVPTGDIAMMMTIAIRFIPTIGEEAARIRDAQLSRGANLGGRGPLKRARAMLPILIPLFVGAFRRSEELSVAMDARCYGAVKRTRLNPQNITALDIKALGVFLIIIAAMLFWEVGL
ncbi:MAG: energy-coupling factor transporter transmembrane component T, partial [Clostridiales bacterium]|nr:energy-coupling factor transporter transmembrane component T [Clostridiales bacterium]